MSRPRQSSLRALTYSIVARDPSSGELGVAVQSHFFSVGSVVSWAHPGVGAVATQSIAEASFGPRGLDLMRDGKSAPAALQQLISDDPGEAVRQVALVDTGGRVAVHTGMRCIPHAGHEVGEQVSVQANMMERDTVPRAMLRAYTESRGEPLPERMLAAMEAAESEGGDIRGRQSAAMLVVAGRASGRHGEDRPVDLRVDDHHDPVGELRRLLGLRRAYTRASAGDDLAGAGDLAGALVEYEAAHHAEPDNLELAFWYGLALAGNGRTDEAVRVMQAPFRAHPGWVELLRRLPEAGIIPDSPELIGLLTGTLAVSQPPAPEPQPPAPEPQPPAPEPQPPARDLPPH